MISLYIVDYYSKETFCVKYILLPLIGNILLLIVVIQVHMLLRV